MLLEILLWPAGLLIALYCLLKYVQYKTVKVLNIRELKHPLYPKKYGLIHHLHFSKNKGADRSQDDTFIIDYMQRNFPQENRVLFWGSPITPVVYYYGGQELREIFTDHSMEKASGLKFLNINESVLTCPVSKHRKARKIIQPAFNKNSLISFNHKVNHHLKVFLKTLSKLTSQTVDLQKLTHLLFLDVTGDTSLGQHIYAQTSTKLNEQHPLVSAIDAWENNSHLGVNFISKNMPYVFLFQFLFKHVNWFLEKFSPKIFYARKQAQDTITAYVDQVMQEKLEQIQANQNQNHENDEADDYSSTLQNSRNKETCLIDQLMSDHISGNIDSEYVSHQIQAFILAGTDTTAYTLSCGVHYLGKPKNLKLQQELRDEVNSILPEKLTVENLENFSLDLDEFSKFVKVKAFIKESLRLFPAVPGIFKQKYVNLGPILSQIRCVIIINPSAVQTDARYWKDPEKFDLSRWLKNENQQQKEKNQELPNLNPTLINNENIFTYVPFSAGKRNCVGQNFAMNNLILSLIYLLKFYHFEAMSDKLKVNDAVVFNALNCFVKFRPNC